MEREAGIQLNPLFPVLGFLTPCFVFTACRIKAPPEEEASAASDSNQCVCVPAEGKSVQPENRSMLEKPHNRKLNQTLRDKKE